MKYENGGALGMGTSCVAPGHKHLQPQKPRADGEEESSSAKRERTTKGGGSARVLSVGHRAMGAVRGGSCVAGGLRRRARFANVLVACSLLCFLSYVPMATAGIFPYDNLELEVSRERERAWSWSSGFGAQEGRDAAVRSFCGIQMPPAAAAAVAVEPAFSSFHNIPAAPTHVAKNMESRGLLSPTAVRCGAGK